MSSPAARPPVTSAGRAPVLFVSHGSPMVALDRGGYAAALGAFGAAHPTPPAVVVVSAHAQAPLPVRVSAHPRPPIVYDFGGFPRSLYALEYRCPGEPAVARRLGEALARAGFPARLDDRMGLDHGAWIPLRLLWPAGQVPVVAVSLPTGVPPDTLVRLGAALAPVRDQGIVVLASGGIVHNLRQVRFGDPDAPVEGWARAFDDWVSEKLAADDRAALLDYRALAPYAAQAAPTPEHFDPLFVALGAAGSGDRPRAVFAGFQHGTISLRTIAFEAAFEAGPGATAAP